MRTEKLLFILAISLASGSAAWAQAGLIFDDEAYRKLPLAAIRSRSTQNKKDLLRYSPKPPEDQGQIASCVGHAIAHAMTIRWAFQCNVTGEAAINSMLFSASYIYNQVKGVPGDCHAGARMTDGLRLAQSQGCCLESSFPNSQYACGRLPGETERAEASQRRIKGYDKLFEIEASPHKKVTALLTALDWNNPAIVCLSGLPATRSGGPSATAGHALVAVDYDEDKKVFTLLDSYRKNKGDNGLVTLSFNEFGQYARYGFIISLGRWDCDLPVTKNK
ncbi:MAG: hypothetical protein J5I98_34860 [Phaeodactylibacter sp.]|nr:hypothetical protein [Phaeodactylibacter sp.]